MPEIQAFRGWRYNLGHVGSLSDVICPPYDVIGPELQSQLYKKHPANVIRLELNREEPGDDASSNKYTRAARFLKNWLNEGVLESENDSAIYVYHQIFEYDGQKYTRRGFMARVRLVRFGEGNIYPHEETHASAKQDRLLLTKACKANISQIFGIYPDGENEVQNTLEEAIVGMTPLEATDHLGVVHRLWPVTNMAVINKASALIANKPMFIADGHHRFETGCNYRDELSAEGPLPHDHPANFVMTMCVGMSDPGMIVLPTHRLFRGLPSLTSVDLAEKLGPYFELTPRGSGSEPTRDLWNDIEISGEQSAIGFYTPKDGKWLLAKLNVEGVKKMAEIATDHSSDWQQLGVSILQRLVIETLFAAKDLPKANYVHLIDEVIEGIDHGDPDKSGEPYPLIALVMPATVGHVKAISEHGERMPAKSTYFYPKLLAGLVINPLS